MNLLHSSQVLTILAMGKVTKEQWNCCRKMYSFLEV